MISICGNSCKHFFLFFLSMGVCRDKIWHTMARQLPLNVPDIGAADKIELISWNVKSGDGVHANQELCELVTEKAAFPLECPFEGRILSLQKKAGEFVKVGETLAILEVAE